MDWCYVFTRFLYHCFLGTRTMVVTIKWPWRIWVKLKASYFNAIDLHQECVFVDFNWYIQIWSKHPVLSIPWYTYYVSDKHYQGMFHDDHDLIWTSKRAIRANTAFIDATWAYKLVDCIKHSVDIVLESLGWSSWMQSVFHQVPGRPSSRSSKKQASVQPGSKQPGPNGNRPNMTRLTCTPSSVR